MQSTGPCHDFVVQRFFLLHTVVMRRLRSRTRGNHMKNGVQLVCAWLVPA